MGFGDYRLEEAISSGKKRNNNEKVSKYGDHGDVDHVDYVDDYSQEAPKKVNKITSIED